MSAFWINRRNFLIGLGLIAFIGFIFWTGSKFDSKVVNVAGHNLHVWVANNPAKQAKGLSGKDSMPDNWGMLFVLPVREVASFWMKGMNFPLDFIWINNGQIVDIRANVSPCPSDGDCPAVSPSVPVNYVLEVNAGWVAANNISIGQSVTGLPDLAQN